MNRESGPFQPHTLWCREAEIFNYFCSTKYKVHAAGKMRFHFVLISLAVLVVVYYIGVTIYIKRNERYIYEEFAQVAMINNSGTPTELPVYTPQFPAPQRKCCKKKCGGPVALPATEEVPDAPDPILPTPTIPDPTKSVTPTAKLPDRKSVTPIAAPPNRVVPRLPAIWDPPSIPKDRQHACAVPQYTVCEVVPVPPIGFHAFRFFAIGDGKSFITRNVGNVEDCFKQTDVKLQPKLLQTAMEWEGVPYFEFTKKQTMAYVQAPPATLEIKANKGCTIVALARVESYDFATDITLIGMSENKYSLTLNDFKYYIQNKRWMLFIKVWDESKDQTGLTILSYIDFMDENDEVAVSQDQSTLPVADVKTLVVAKPGTDPSATQGAALSVESAMATHIAYASVYDRALTDKERNMVLESVRKILDNQPIFEDAIEAVVDYDIMASKQSSEFDQRTVKDRNARNMFHLRYNMDIVPEKYEFRPFPSLRLTKNDKYYTDRSVYLEMPDGYSIELMFCVEEFSNDVASVIFCYSVIASESGIPQLIAGVTATDSAKGNLFYVQFFTQEIKTGRLESSVRISPGEWYHVIVTSDSKIFVNGVRDKDARGRAVTNFPAASGRYISIGDYKNPDIDSTTSDYGNTMHGGISLARIYNAPVTQAKVDQLYFNVKPNIEMTSHLGV
jgi:hypothetical protein